MNGYKRSWQKWLAYLSDKEITDPYLKGYPEGTKVELLCNLFRTRYISGKRGKGAYEIGAGIKKFFHIELQPLGFFESPLTTGARTACRLTTDELRAVQRDGTNNDKLPIFWEMLSTMRETHWNNRSWAHPDIDLRMTVIGALVAYELANRGGEVCSVGGSSSENHTIYNEQVAFTLEEPVVVHGKIHRGFAAGTTLFREGATRSNIASCAIGVASHKTGAVAVHNVKVIKRENERESELLDDLFEWCIHSGSTSQEPLCSRWAWSGRKVTHKKLVPKMMATLIKTTADGLGLDGKEFANHSFRKGALTQMQAAGCLLGETNARGNYSRDSKLATTAYNHNNTGRGPTGASSAIGAREITGDDVRKHSKSARFN
jgi:hypothetical protein